MTRTELACYGLLASAVVLAALLVTRLQDGAMVNTAHAEMVISGGGFTAMTARTRRDEEALFVLENSSQRLLIYSLNLTHNRLDLAHDPISLGQLFGNQQPQPGAATPGRRPR
jgi:hypothetical protein